MGKSPGQGMPQQQQPAAAPQMGVINSGQPAGSDPVSYYMNQADIPVGQMGLVRPNPGAIGVNNVIGTPPPPPPPDPRMQLAQMLGGRTTSVGTQYGPNAELSRLDRFNAMMGSRGSRGGGASQGDRQGATTSGRDNWGGSSGGRGWW